MTFSASRRHCRCFLSVAIFATLFFSAPENAAAADDDASAPGPVANPVPDDNPYAAAIAAWNALPAEQRSRLQQTSEKQVSPDPPQPSRQGRGLFPPSPPPPSFAQLAADPTTSAVLQTIGQALRNGGEARSVDWGVNMNQNPENIVFEHVGDARAFAYIALAQADSLVANDPQTAVTLAADVFALSRHVSETNTLITSITQAALDGVATRWLASRLPELPAQAVSELQRRMENLPEGGRWSACFPNEKRYAEAFLDRIVGLAALTPAEDSDRSAKTLRMAGLLGEGDNVSISLETADGSFWLKTGQTLHGVRLVNVDIKKQQALLSYEGRLVQLQLESRKLVDLDTIRVTLSEDDPLRKMVEMLSGSEPAPLPETLAQWVSVYQEITDYYDALAARFDAFDFDDTTALHNRLSEQAKTLTMHMTMLQRFAAAGKIREAQLAAALDAAVAGKLPSGVSDPVTQKTFRIIPEKTPDGAENAGTGGVAANAAKTGYVIESDFIPSTHRPDPVRLVVGRVAVEP
ncbi:hypothetical protein OPIT5_28740 [Opitutaceae bacterium TAV5]|nr:hypothetical protein OPIT5_28740 [Opitutaceae bacterium TAV5]